MSQLPADVDAFGGIVPNPLGPNVSQEQYKRRRGAESKYFDKSQTAEMDALIPELLQFLRSPRTNEEFAEWTEGKATILLSRPTFLSAITPVADGTRTVKHAQHKIHRFFYHRKPKQTRTGTSSTSSSSTSSSSALSPAATTSSSTSSTSTTSTFAEDEALRIVRLARRSKLLLEGEYKARDHFIASNAELIQEKIKELKSTSTVNGKALENIAISKLWNDADKALYESMANDFAANVSGNQESFPWLLHTMLTDIVKTNLLGDVALKLNLAFRDAQSDLKTYTVRVAYNATSRSTVEFVPKHQDEEESSWAIEADGLLPRHVETPLVKIMTNGAGVPMWPSIDLENTTPRQLKGVVEMYLKAVWILERKGPRHSSRYLSR
ncbi:hypothetical protein DFP72DRAFT_516509 [Ephemerocybe angulata]|uniref:Uncharacterized protein n=1 Tax=Ephemerocybe angulata TaxID=980116 RepID=A0A8H6HQV2_9AGAR|nr:hypothetical protein DFP72DRAFT_516509 [Tulosesus angulatus]